MPTVIIALANGFEEVEAISVIDILRRAAIDVTTAGVRSPEITGSHQVPVKTDTTFSEASSKEYDAIVLPGGPGTDTLEETPGLKELLQRHAQNGKLIAAICAGPSILAKAGLLQGRKAACHPSVEEEMYGADISYDPVVYSGNFITSRGAGTAIDFALALTARLVSPEKAREIAKRIVHPSPDLPFLED